MRWSILIVALGLVACNRESLTRIEYGPLVAVEARLDDSVITAGEETTVTCVLKAEEGFEVLDPQTYSTYVETVVGLQVDGYTVGGILPGEYEVRCAVVGSPSITQLPDQLTIEPAEAQRLELRVVPDQAYFGIGDSAVVHALVLDGYGNVIDGFEDLVEWSVPSNGLTRLTAEQGQYGFSFDADGMYGFSADIGAPYNLSATELVLVCDSIAPELVLTRPERGESLSDSTITVSGTVTDEMSGLATLTVNGVAIVAAPNGSFTTDLLPEHGLNHIAVVATDEAGHVSVANTSVYHSPAWRPIGEDSFDAAMPEGLGVHLSQDVIDVGARDCGKDGAGVYVCAAYEDMATVAEVVLNSMDLNAMASGPIYRYGPILLAEENLGSQAIDIGALTFGLANYLIHGSFILRGDYTISVNIASVELGRADMGDQDTGILGLTAVDGGLDLLAYLRPDGDREVGLRILLELRIDVDLRVFFSVDESYHPDNGVWDLDTGADVTVGACAPSGALAIIDAMMGLFGYEPNFHGYICVEDPMITSYPNASTGADLAFELSRISGRMLFETTDDGLIDVTLKSHANEPLIDFLGQALTVDSDQDIVIDLTSVDVFDGLFTVDLGTINIGNPLELLDPVLTTMLTELQFVVAFALEDMIVCENSLSGCPLNVEGLIEDIFNSLARRDLDLIWPAVMPDGDDMSVAISQYFSSVSFDSSGGKMGFDTALTTVRGLHESIAEPRGTLLRGDCAGSGALAALPDDRHMAAGFDLDLVNQAMLMGWYNGGLGGTLTSSALGGSIESFTAVMHPLLPPVVTACTGNPDELEFQLGAARLDLSMRVAGVLVEATVFSDLALAVEPHHSAGRLDLLVSGEPRLNEIELLTTDVRLGSYEQAIKDIIAGELMPDLLARFGETVLAGIPVPTINLADASLPGLELDIVLDFPVTDAVHEAAVIVVVSD